MANFNLTNPISAFWAPTGTYKYTSTVGIMSAGTALSAMSGIETLSGVCILALNAFDTLTGSPANLSAYGTTNTPNNIAVSATLQFNVGRWVTPYSSNTTQVTGLSAIFPPLLTLIGNPNQTTQGSVVASTLNTVQSAATFSIEFDEPAFYNTVFSLSGNFSILVNNGSQVDNLFYQSAPPPTLGNNVILNPSGPIPGLSSTNLGVTTIGSHCRKRNMEYC